MKKVLIFTAGFGEGHNTAARSIRDAIEHIAPDDARVEVLDLFESCYGRLNDLVRKAYLAAINRAPRVWGKIYEWLDNSTMVETNLAALARMRNALADVLRTVEPDAVVSTYPVYNYLIDEIYSDGRERNFSQITVVTDSISINSVWYRGFSDYFLVPNEQTAEVMRNAGIPQERLRVFGFPVTHRFADLAASGSRSIPGSGPKKVLYMINSGKKQAPRLLRKLLKLDDIELTITVGRDIALRNQIEAVVRSSERKVQIFGWTNKMPELLHANHLVISKAGGATVQETIAARCPLIISQIVPGQEEGNARLILENDCGAHSIDPDETVEWVKKAFEKKCELWHSWFEHLAPLSRPAASLDIARFVLSQSAPENAPIRRLTAFEKPTFQPTKKLLLCDLHTHTVYSDGKLTVREIVDFYGQRGFDALCVTDHICDPTKFIGKVSNLSGLVLTPDQVPEYFETIEEEKKRALDKYGLILMTGLEFNKDGLTKKTSAHLLAVDLKAPIDPGLSIKDTIKEIHKQGALAIASHPHEFQTTWGKDTLYFWENIEQFAPLLDAWEIANRDDIYNPVGLKKLPFIANSDFHKPKHIYSWKTMVHAEKDPEAIKQAIRVNRDVAITLYRDHKIGFGYGDVEQPARLDESLPGSLLHFNEPAAIQVRA